MYNGAPTGLSPQQLQQLQQIVRAVQGNRPLGQPQLTQLPGVDPRTFAPNVQGIDNAVLGQMENSPLPGRPLPPAAPYAQKLKFFG